MPLAINIIIYPRNSISYKIFPSAILIKFDNYTGPSLFSVNDYRQNWIPINPFNAYNQVNGFLITKYTIHFSNALTIHKSQGQTLEKAVLR